MVDISNNRARYETSIAGWSLAIANALGDYGINSRQVFLQAGIDLDRIRSPSERMPIAAVQKVWQFADHNTDGCFGVCVAQKLTPASLHALGFALWCSATLKEFFERYIRYRCVLSHMHFCELTEERDLMRLSLVDERTIKSEITNDAAAGYFVSLLRQLCGGKFAPREMHITRTLGHERQKLEAFFQTALCDGADSYALFFEREQLESPLRFANPELAIQLDAAIELYIVDLGLISEYMLRVRTEIHRLLETGCVSVEQVAENLCVTTRTLQRRLASESSSYNLLLDQVRQQLAIEYSIAPGASATEIAFRLGFTDSGSFGRSFRRWTGHSFTDYRRRGSFR